MITQMNAYTVDVSTNPKRILTVNRNRVCYIIINNSLVDVYIGGDSSVSTTGLNKGVLVAAQGGVWVDDKHTGDVYAVASSSTEITVVEITKVSD